MTAGMATNRPNAVVTRASEIPPATAPIPEVFWVAMAWKAFKNADDGAEQADERRGRTDGGETAEAALQLGVNDGFGAFESALRALNLLLGDGAARTEAAELLQAGGDDFGEVRLLAAVAQLDRLVQTAILQGSGNLGRKLARLLAGCVEVQRSGRS